MSRTKKPKEKHRYVFPDILAKAMAKVDMRSQMEASMLSQFLLIIGLTLMVIFMIISTQTSGLYKFIVIFNLLCGWVLISSYLVTTYQQYTSYAGAMGFDPAAEKAAVKKKGNIFKRIKLSIKNKRAKKRKNITTKTEMKDIPINTEMKDIPINTEMKDIPINTEMKDIPINTEMKDIPINTEMKGGMNKDE